MCAGGGTDLSPTNISRATTCLEGGHHFTSRCTTTFAMCGVAWGRQQLKDSAVAGDCGAKQPSGLLCFILSCWDSPALDRMWQDIVAAKPTSTLEPVTYSWLDMHRVVQFVCTYLRVKPIAHSGVYFWINMLSFFVFKKIPFVVLALGLFVSFVLLVSFWVDSCCLLDWNYFVWCMLKSCFLWHSNKVAVWTLLGWLVWAFCHIYSFIACCQETFKHMHLQQLHIFDNSAIILLSLIYSICYPFTECRCLHVLKQCLNYTTLQFPPEVPGTPWPTN